MTATREAAARAPVQEASPGGHPRRGRRKPGLDRKLLRHSDLDEEVREHIRLGLEAQDWE